MDTFTFDGINSGDYGIYVIGDTDDILPEPVYDTFDIPGRTGALHINTGKYANIDRTYRCVCMGDAKTNVPNFLKAIAAGSLSVYTYYTPMSKYTSVGPVAKKITDTIHTDYFKMGSLKGVTEPNYKTFKKAASFDITFDCDPRKWLVSGDTWIDMNPEQNVANLISNPTEFPAYSLIRCNFEADIVINGISTGRVKVNSYKNVSDNIIEIDTEILEYQDTIGETLSDVVFLDRNGNPQRDSRHFLFAPITLNTKVENLISATGTIFQCKPRWYKI